MEVEDSLKSNTNMFKMQASMKASYLGGMVSLKGSASFLKDQMTSENQCRLLLTYAQDTKYKYVHVDEMGDVKVPQVFSDQATHVVIGIYYGAKAFMVCDKFASSSENKQEIMSQLEVAAQKLDSGSDGSGRSYSASLENNFKQEEKEQLNRMSCRYHGDIIPDTVPTNLKSALTVISELPGLVKKSGIGKPVRVVLYRLSKLEKHGSNALKVVNTVTEDLGQDLEDVFEDIKKAEIKAKDLIDACEDLKIHAMKDKITRFQEELRDYRIHLKMNLKTLLPLIRRGEEQLQKLEDIIKFHEESVFNLTQMLKWLNSQNNLITWLKDMANEGVDKVSCPDLFSHTNNYSLKWLYVLSFTSLEEEDPYLSTLSKFLDIDAFKKMEDISVARQSSKELKSTAVTPPYERIEVKASMKGPIDEFRYRVLYQGYKGIITCKSDPAAPGAKLELYNYGVLSQVWPKV